MVCVGDEWIGLDGMGWDGCDEEGREEEWGKYGKRGWIRFMKIGLIACLLACYKDCNEGFKSRSSLDILKTAQS